MFAESLLESSTGRKRKRWPVATAFTVQTIVAAVVVIVPLLSTGVIQLSARVHIVDSAPVQLEPVRPTPHGPTSHSGPASAPTTQVVLLDNNRPALPFGRAVPRTNNPDDVRPDGRYIGESNLPSDLLPKGNGDGTNVKPEQRRISVPSEAQLINRVEPVYPRVAIAAGIQGSVKLHAIIARSGRIESLELISGPPLLVQAALDAVRQWRYRPYYLNGEAVEVETFITVNFTRERR
jgi:periplasmic protein TonB